MTDNGDNAELLARLRQRVTRKRTLVDSPALTRACLEAIEVLTAQVQRFAWATESCVEAIENHLELGNDDALVEVLHDLRAHGVVPHRRCPVCGAVVVDGKHVGNCDDPNCDVCCRATPQTGRPIGEALDELSAISQAAGLHDATEHSGRTADL